MLSLLKSLWNDEAGATPVEYALLLAAVAIPMIGVWQVFAVQLDYVLCDIVDEMGQPVTP